MSLFWNLSDVLGRKTTEGKRHPHHIIRNIGEQHDIIDVVDLDHFTEVLFVRFLLCKVTFPNPFLNCTLWKEVTMHNPHLRSGCGVMPHFLKTVYLHLFRILLFSQIFFSVIYLFQYGLMDILFFELRSNTILFILLFRFFQLWPQVGSRVPLTYSHLFKNKNFFENFLTFWHYRIIQFLDIYFKIKFYTPLSRQKIILWKIFVYLKSWLCLNISKMLERYQKLRLSSQSNQKVHVIFCLLYTHWSILSSLQL